MTWTLLVANMLLRECRRSDKRVPQERESAVTDKACSQDHQIFFRHCGMVIKRASKIHIDSQPFELSLIGVPSNDMLFGTGDPPLVMSRGGSKTETGSRDGRPFAHCQYWRVQEHFAMLRLPPEMWRSFSQFCPDCRSCSASSDTVKKPDGPSWFVSSTNAPTRHCSAISCHGL
jgi:hypothetical protein